MPLDGTSRPDKFVSGPQLERSSGPASAKETDGRLFEIEEYLDGLRRDIDKRFAQVSNAASLPAPPVAPTLEVAAGPPIGTLHWLQKNYPEEYGDSGAIFPRIVIRAKLPNGTTLSESGLTLVVAVWDTTQGRGYAVTEDVTGTDVGNGYNDAHFTTSGIQCGDSCYAILVALANASGYAETTYGATDRPFTAAGGLEAPEAPTIVKRWNRERKTKFCALWTRSIDYTEPFTGPNCSNFYESMELWERSPDGAGNNPEATNADGWAEIKTLNLKRITKALKRNYWPTQYPLTTPSSGAGTWGALGNSRTFTPTAAPSWTTNEWKGYILVYAERPYLILSNTTTALTVKCINTPVAGAWANNGDGTYTFTPTAAQTWQDEQWQGCLLTAGTTNWEVSDSDAATGASVNGSITVLVPSGTPSGNVTILGPAASETGNGRIHRFMYYGVGTASAKVFTPTYDPNWETDQWIGFYLVTNTGQVKRVASNTDTTVTVTTGRLDSTATSIWISKPARAKKFVVEHKDPAAPTIGARIADSFGQVGQWSLGSGAPDFGRPSQPMLELKRRDTAGFDIYKVHFDIVNDSLAKRSYYDELEVYHAPSGTAARTVASPAWAGTAEATIGSYAVKGTSTAWTTVMVVGMTISFDDSTPDAYAYDVVEVQDDETIVLGEPYGADGADTAASTGSGKVVAGGWPDDPALNAVWTQKQNKKIKRLARRGKTFCRTRVHYDSNNPANEPKEIAVRIVDIFDRTSLWCIGAPLSAMVMFNDGTGTIGALKLTDGQSWLDVSIPLAQRLRDTGEEVPLTVSQLKDIVSYGGRVFFAWQTSGINGWVEHRIWYTDDAGATWNSVAGPAPANATGPVSICIGPTGKLFAVFQTGGGGSGRWLYRLDSTWALNASPPASPTWVQFTGADIVDAECEADLFSPDVVWAWTINEVFISTNANSAAPTWTQVRTVGIRYGGANRNIYRIAPGRSPIMPPYTGSNKLVLWACTAGGGLHKGFYDGTNLLFVNESAENVPIDINLGDACVDYGPGASKSSLVKTCLDAAVTSATDTINITNHGFLTGEWITYTTSGVAPITGLTSGSRYYIYQVDAHNFRLCASYADTVTPTVIDITQPAGGDTHTFTRAAAGFTTNFCFNLDRGGGKYWTCGNANSSPATQGFYHSAAEPTGPASWTGVGPTNNDAMDLMFDRQDDNYGFAITGTGTVDGGFWTDDAGDSWTNIDDPDGFKASTPTLTRKHVAWVEKATAGLSALGKGIIFGPEEY